MTFPTIGSPRQIDANVLLRVLVGEPRELFEKAERLIDAVRRGEHLVRVEDVVLAEVVWVLSSFYRMDRRTIVDLLTDIVVLDGVVMPDKQMLNTALKIFAEVSVKFVDAILAAKVLAAGETNIW